MATPLLVATAVRKVYRTGDVAVAALKGLDVARIRPALATRIAD